MNTPDRLSRPAAACSCRTPLPSDVRLSGTAAADLAASLGADAGEPERRVIVDYGAGTQIIAHQRRRHDWRPPHLLGRRHRRRPVRGQALGAACTPTDDDIPAQRRSRTRAT